MGLDQASDRVECLLDSAVFLGRKQPEMPLMELYFLCPWDGSQHWDVTVFFDARPHDRLVAGGAHLIQNDPLYRDLLVQDLAAFDQSRHGTGRFGAIHYEKDRQPQELGQRSRTVLTLHIDPIEEAAVSLHNGHLGSACPRLEGSKGPFFPHQVGIQVVAGSRCRRSEPCRIDVVRALLEDRKALSLRSPRGQKAQADQGLACSTSERPD